jgi:EAL domain-containing protein (putative c-di-GMP-specific phosphodiesterase class I)
VLPSKFLPLAEQSGLIVPIGSWVLRQACNDMAAWRADLPDAQPLALHVNISTRQLEDDSFAADVTTALSDAGLDPGSLTLEIAEGVMPRNGDAAADRLGRVRAIGVRIAIDDFDAGSIAIDLLGSLGVDAIKVDRSLAERASEGRRHGDAARAVIDAGRALGLDVIAEAIEHEAQADAMRALGCTHAQGYHYARPMPAADFARLVESLPVENATHAA